MKEGLIFQDQVSLLAQCIVTDCVVGLPHRVDLTHASTARLSAAIHKCETKRLKDPSAAAIVSLSGKLLDIRRTFLLYCRIAGPAAPREDNAEEDEEDAGGGDPPPEIQLADKAEVLKRVMAAVEDYFQYFVRANEIFRNTFQIPADLDYLREGAAGRPAQPSPGRTVSEGIDGADRRQRQPPSPVPAAVLDWTHEVYLSVCCACEEVKLISSHMTFRSVHQAIVSSLLIAPDCLQPFLQGGGHPDLRSLLQQLQAELSMEREEGAYLSSMDSDSNTGSASGESASTEFSLLAAEELFFDSRSFSVDGLDDGLEDRAAAGEFHIGVLRRVRVGCLLCGCHFCRPSCRAVYVGDDCHLRVPGVLRGVDTTRGDTGSRRYLQGSMHLLAQHRPISDDPDMTNPYTYSC